MNKLPFLFLALMMFVGCKGAKKASGPPDESDKLWLSQWELMEMNGKEVKYNSDKTANLLFSPAPENRISGNTSCNRMTGTYQLNGAKSIKFSPMATTRMACLEGSDIENKFLGVLQRANSFSILDNVLMLYNGKALLARFRPIALVDPE